MRLAQRLLAGSLTLVGVLVVFVIAIASERLRERLYRQTGDELEREARVVSARWQSSAAADPLADSLGAILGHRVTLIDSGGTVRGDSDFEPDQLAALENHASRPEIVAARARGVGRSQRPSPSRGDDELYVAVRAPLGTARVAVGTRTVDRIVAGARRDVLIAGLASAAVALLLAWLFSRSVSRPISELSDVARGIASGDLGRRPTLAAPGEVGDLAAALHRMAEQLAARLAALERDDALMIALLDSLGEGVIAVDEGGRVVRTNAGALTLLGISERVPFPADRLPRDPALRAALNDAIAGDATDGVELRLHGRTLLLAARPLSGHAGAVLALLDLTPIRRLETVRRDFVANVSHELKTPLTVILGFAETLADHEPSEPQRRKFIEAMRSNAQRMQRLVDDLLDLSRIESGVWQPQLVSIDVAALASEAASAIQIDDKLIAQYRKLVAEAYALFGDSRWDAYHFLVVCSDTLPRNGLEHLSCSFNAVGERELVDDKKRKSWPAYLLPHEFVHSWCGKFRRPAGMVTTNFHRPERTRLLWIYEGLTQYLGEVLTVRSGLLTFDDTSRPVPALAERIRTRFFI